MITLPMLLIISSKISHFWIQEIHLYKLDVNKGKGGALNFARPYIDTDFVVIHDADLEYFPDDIELMYQELKAIDSFVLGSRFLGEKRKLFI